ncbi:MAG: nuclear transport factor 2 family protein [Actinomycetota bacterium]|nr:nuclear transport factor 2 family protein [Actinomycetota bacterium]
MARTPQETFRHHLEAVSAANLDEIVTDYSTDAIVMTPAGVQRGKDGVRQAFIDLLDTVPDAEWDVPTQVFEEDILLIEWSADSPKNRIDDGVDTFVFNEDGQIRVQTLHYTPQPKG